MTDQGERDGMRLNAQRLASGKDRALGLLLEGLSVREVAAELEVSRATVWRWTREPSFAARYSEAVRSGLVGVATRLDAAAVSAVDVLLELAEDPEQPAMVRVRAAGLLVANATAARRAAGDARADDAFGQLPQDELFRLAAEQIAARPASWPVAFRVLAASDPRSAEPEPQPKPMTEHIQRKPRRPSSPERLDDLLRQADSHPVGSEERRARANCSMLLAIEACEAGVITTQALSAHVQLALRIGWPAVALGRWGKA